MNHNTTNQILGTYKNGNYSVIILKDGSKLRFNNENTLVPSFAESIDLNITNKCDGRCPFCYQNANTTNQHPDILNKKFIETLHPYTEIALNGNDLTHPQLNEFLKILKEKKVIANITVNQKHYLKNKAKIYEWHREGLIHGIGISINYDSKENLNSLVRSISLTNSMRQNIVFHSIAGLLNQDIINVFNQYTTKDENVKIKNVRGFNLLILGYKNFGRGISYDSSHHSEIEENMKWLKVNLKDLVNNFSVLSFDNLALEQIDVKNTLKISDKFWEKMYMGNEGQYTFYIDLAKNCFAKNSFTEKCYDLLDNVDDMFEVVRKESNG